MAERKAQNKYYPPEWEPSMGSINKYRKGQTRRQRARVDSDSNLRTRKVRFEIPYNIWCTNCDKIISKGIQTLDVDVRFNAEKKQVGKYFTTPILRFEMQHLCGGTFELQTDPKSGEYLVVSGAKRKYEFWDASMNETIELISSEESKKLATNPFFKLEYSQRDELKTKIKEPELCSLQVQREAFKNDFKLSQMARARSRDIRRKKERIHIDKVRIEQKFSLATLLMDEHPDDISTSKRVNFQEISKKRKTYFEDSVGESKVSLQKATFLVPYSDSD